MEETVLEKEEQKIGSLPEVEVVEIYLEPKKPHHLMGHTDHHMPAISSIPCLKLPMRSLSQSFSGRSTGKGMRSTLHSCSNLVPIMTSIMNSSNPSNIIFGSSRVRKVAFEQEKVAVAKSFFSSNLAFKFAMVDTS